MVKNISNDDLAKIIRRLDSLEKKLDLLYEDRQILESIQGRITGLEEQTKLSRQHDNEVRKDIKEEVNIIGDHIENKVDELSSQIESKKVIKIVPERTFWQKIMGRK
jgi:tetrahydromethanopterin S-methyltransferase subunit G